MADTKQTQKLDPTLMCCGYCGYLGAKDERFKEIEREVYVFEDSISFVPQHDIIRDKEVVSYPVCPHCKKWNFRGHSSSAFVGDWSKADLETIMKRNKKNFPLCNELDEMIQARYK
jgi:hypothetical protein